MIRKLSLAAAVLAVGALTWNTVARAGDPVPAAPAAEPAKAAPAEAPKVDAPKTAETTKPETKTPSPILSVMFWLGHQVAPQLDCACPAKSAEGEKAWRDWFAGGKDVPAAAIRDALVADGWTADRFVTFFKDMVAKQNAVGSCAGGKCAEATKGDTADAKGKDCGGACHGKGAGCGSCPGCPGKDAKPEAPKTDTPEKPATEPKP